MPKKFDLVRLVRISTIVLVIASMNLLAVDLPVAKATDTSLDNYLNGQYYNTLVSNGNFVDINSMSAGAIQDFLSSKGSYLAGAPSSQLGDGANGRSAAQIIWDAAHANYDAAAGCADSICINTGTGTISPKAIMITLQKEQSLITTSDYNPGRLNAAMGYGCPDSGGCNSQYAGFSNQVGWGAWQLRWNYERSPLKHDQYYAGNVISIADRDGVRPVYLSNHATASLYRYTPHTYYGNYNFWKLGIEWFGFDGSSTNTNANVNDTSSVSARMYDGSYTVRGTKKSDDRTYYGGQLLANTGTTSWQFTFTPDTGTHDYNFAYKTGDGSADGTKLVTVEKHKQADINGDGKVNLLDLSMMSNAWGKNVKDFDWVNLNPQSDNDVNLLDVSIFANHWEG